MNTFTRGDKVTFKMGSTVCAATIREVPTGSDQYYSVETTLGHRFNVHANHLKPASGGEQQ